MAKDSLEDMSNTETEKNVDGIVSKNVIHWLKKTTGNSCAEIGEKIGLSENTVYIIQEGKRGLTLYRLRKMERA